MYFLQFQLLQLALSVPYTSDMNRVQCFRGGLTTD